MPKIIKYDIPIFICVLIDALGWEYIKNRDFLKHLLPNQKKLSTILGFSCSAIPSILSGKYPDEHGQWNLYYYSPKTSPFRWTKGIPLLRNGFAERVMRKIIEEASKKISRSDGYFETYLVPLPLLNLFDISEKRNIYKEGGLNSVSSIFDWMNEKSIKNRVYNYRQGPDMHLIRDCINDISNGVADVYFVYLSQMDSYLHENCLDDKYIDSKLVLYKKGLERLYKTAEETGREVIMHCFSDHGMVSTERTIDLIARIEESGLKQPDDFLAMYDSTMGRFWCFSQRARNLIMAILDDSVEGHVMTENELRDQHVWFENNLYGEIIFLLKPGILIEPSYMGRKAPAGMHGCHPDNPFCDAMIMSNQNIELDRDDITTIFYLIQNDLIKHLV